MDDAKLNELQALADAATPGPWTEAKRRIVAQTDPPNGPWETLFKLESGTADSAFVQAARTAVPELVAEVRRLRGRDGSGLVWWRDDVLKEKVAEARRGERERCLAELKRLHAGNERILPTGDLDSTPVFEGQKFAFEQAIEAIEDLDE